MVGARAPLMSWKQLMTAVGTLIAGFFLVFQVVLGGVQGNVESIQGSVGSIQEDIRRLAAEGSTNFRGLEIEVSGLRGDLGGLRDEVSGLRSDFLAAFGQRPSPQPPLPRPRPRLSPQP